MIFNIENRPNNFVLWRMMRRNYQYIEDIDREYNIGVNYIDNNHKLASIEVLKFIFSKEFQKEIYFLWAKNNEKISIYLLYIIEEIYIILSIIFPPLKPVEVTEETL
ncbi:hypothetical protein H8356DRAFT_1332617 [Neocallimastix lanati (nom. inval.)]|nr:hypothetical protein H8356DRAFT_1332617 [Neocallimastix sp. JGI-2020a]